MMENKFIKRIASSLVALGISTIAYSNSWAENLKIGVAGPYTGEMSNYGISAKKRSDLSNQAYQRCLRSSGYRS